MEKLDNVIVGLGNCLMGICETCPYAEVHSGACRDGVMRHAMELLKEYRQKVPVSVGDVIYEADGEHGVVAHTVTEVLWVANSKAVDVDGNEWADQWMSGDESLIHRTHEDAQCELCVSCGNCEYVHEYEIYMCRCGDDCQWKPKEKE